tara:strand:- start:41 stop:487 length:447 start_codon:yes stop_codon:yes gene_type:complete
MIEWTTRIMNDSWQERINLNQRKSNNDDEYRSEWDKMNRSKGMDYSFEMKSNNLETVLKRLAEDMNKNFKGFWTEDEHDEPKLRVYDGGFCGQELDIDVKATWNDKDFDKFRILLSYRETDPDMTEENEEQIDRDMEDQFDNLTRLSY